MENENLTMLNVDETNYQTTLTKKYMNKKAYIPKDIKKLIAFIPGAIRDIFVKEGQKVNAGEKLLILEAMKMKNIIKSPIDAKIKKIYVAINQNIPKNEIMIELE